MSFLRRTWWSGITTRKVCVLWMLFGSLRVKELKAYTTVLVCCLSSESELASSLSYLSVATPSNGLNLGNRAGLTVGPMMAEAAIKTAF